MLLHVQRLTREALKQLALTGTEAQTSAAFEKMKHGEKQVVWKSFEYARGKHDDSLSQAWSSCQGAGTNAKKKLLLISWLRDGQKVGTHCSKVIHTMKASQVTGTRLDWLTWNEAVTKYGRTEAKQRVLGGTLLSKPDPTDKRFFISGKI